MSYIRRIAAPDGRHYILLAAMEMRMFHWVESPSLWTADGTTPLVDLGDSLWSADQVTWSEDSLHVTLAMRRYPGDGLPVVVDLFPVTRGAVLHTPEGAEEFPFDLLPGRLEQFYAAHRAI
jgi:hypothetical protein